MTPADFRALAARVETEEPTEALNEAVARAFGWQHEAVFGSTMYWQAPGRRGIWELAGPEFFVDLGDAAALMPEGWRITSIQQRQNGSWLVMAATPFLLAYEGCTTVVYGDAPTERRARVAAALRAKAADLEAGDDVG